MKKKMREINSPLGGEVSGHLFIGENYYGFDDAPLVALKTLEIIAASGKTISDLFADVPKLVATPEIIMSAPDHVKFKIIEEIAEQLHSKYEVVTIDGARALFPHGWGLVRASNTQPAVTMRFEAYTNEQIVEYMNVFKALLDPHPEIDQSGLVKQIKAFGG
jgi:phosphomannomutase / phosphoglucomutase